MNGNTAGRADSPRVAHVKRRLEWRIGRVAGCFMLPIMAVSAINVGLYVWLGITLNERGTGVASTAQAPIGHIPMEEVAIDPEVLRARVLALGRQLDAANEGIVRIIQVMQQTEQQTADAAGRVAVLRLEMEAVVRELQKHGLMRPGAVASP
jgi:hypothetical protein